MATKHKIVLYIYKFSTHKIILFSKTNLGFFLKFRNFRNFQPRYSLKMKSYIKIE